jgi:hypothetical protein
MREIESRTRIAVLIETGIKLGQAGPVDAIDGALDADRANEVALAQESDLAIDARGRNQGHEIDRRLRTFGAYRDRRE